MGHSIIQEGSAVREILQRAALRREMLILVTPYLRFESSFLGIEGDELLVAATMGREDAVYGLRNPDLKMRFPSGTSFLEARVRMLGLGRWGSAPALRLGMPEALRDDDQRGAYRVERVGRVEVTFSTPRFDLYAGGLLDISTTGARVATPAEPAALGLDAGQTIELTIPLAEGLTINQRARIRHLHGRSMGLEFQPVLEDRLLTGLSRWVFQRREEDRARSDRAMDLELARDGGQGSPGGGSPCLALLSADAGLAETLGGLLKDLPSLVRFQPSIQALKDALALDPLLLILHVQGAGLDERRRLRALVDALAAQRPFLLLGTEMDNTQLFSLSGELRAAGAYLLGPQPGAFFARLVQGVLRRQRALDGGQG